MRDPAVLERARELLETRDREARRRAILCVERIGYARRRPGIGGNAARTRADVAVERRDGNNADRSQPADAAAPASRQAARELARRPEWQVWSTAVQCLHLANAPDVEPALLERVDANPELLPYIARELRYMSSDASLEALARLRPSGGSATLAASASTGC